jgi:hypothetical protein
MDIHYQRQAGVAARDVAGSCLLIPAGASARSVFTLNPTANHLWELLAEPQSADMLAQSLAESYRIGIDRARRDVAIFLSEMQARGLIKATPENGVASGAQKG